MGTKPLIDFTEKIPKQTTVYMTQGVKKRIEVGKKKAKNSQGEALKKEKKKEIQNTCMKDL